MTEDRRDPPPPRPPLTVRTLVIASIASVVGALVVTRLGYTGKLVGAAMAPIIVLLVSEFGHRSSTKIEKTAEKVVPVVITRARPHAPRRHGGEPPTTVLPVQAAKGESEGETLRLPPPTPESRSRPYAVHVSEQRQRARRTTRNRIAGVLLAAGCGLAIAVGGFTLLSAATGGHVNAGVRVATVHRGPSAKSKKQHTSDQNDKKTDSTSTSKEASTSKETTTKGSDSSTSTTSTAPTTTTSPGTTQSATTETAPATTAATAPGTTSGTPPSAQTTPAATPPAGTGG